ncbi:MAG TPA: FecR family protein [Chroococcales cyanobacterium]
MKRSFFLILCLLFLFSSSGASASNFLASLGEHSGKVEVLRTGTTAWSSLEDGGELFAGDQVRTSEQSTALIERKDGSTLELLSLAEVTVVDEKGFFVRLGQVWSHFVKVLKGDSFLKTPTTTALIRGTILSVSHDGQDSRVIVREGLVSVRDANQGEVEVAGGHAVSINRGRLSRLERAENKEMIDGRRFFERMQRLDRFKRNQDPRERRNNRLDRRPLQEELQKERRDRQQEEHRQRRDLRQKNRLDQPPQRVRP